MRYLFIHQNFPGQFRHVAQALARQGHEVRALAITGQALPGVALIHYPLPQPPLAQPSAVPGVGNFETAAWRGWACAQAMEQLKRQGYAPDVVVAHPGWGEAAMVTEIWPACRLVVFSEFFYHTQGADVNFDPEFALSHLAQRYPVELKNAHLLLALAQAHTLVTPTEWQKAQLPLAFRAQTQVIFDGVDTSSVAPDASAWFSLARAGCTLRPGDEVITFVNRNFEPCRGFHVFMRTLPRLLARRPQARVVLMGGDDRGYGPLPAGGGTWRQALLKELDGQLPMDRIHFVGRLPRRDYLRVLQVSACHVYLTYPFVLSWSLVEAMAAACAIVASDTPPVAEFMTHARHGQLVNFFDQDALAQAIEQALDAPAPIRQWRQAARDHIVDRYDLHRHCLPAQLKLLS